MANATPREHSFLNKSWVELCEEENQQNSSGRTEYFGGENESERESTIETKQSPMKKDSESERKVIYDRKKSSGDTLDLFVDEDTLMSTSSPLKATSTPPKLFSSYAHVLKNASPEGEESRRDDCGNQEVGGKKVVKREIQKDFLQEDLSLTSHLDVFHMQSPCKGKADADRYVEVTRDTSNENIKTSFPRIDEWPMPVSAKKQSPDSKHNNIHTTTGESRELRSAKRRMPLKQVDSDQSAEQRHHDQIPDDVLMPSPSKMIRSVPNNTDSLPRNSLESRKRQRENYSKQRDSFSSPLNKKDNSSRPGESFSSPLHRTRSSNSSPSTRRGDNFSSPSNRSQSEVEHETDAAILSRRQKQINYGKNTVGYERYTEDIPRDKREKKHPKTPPRHLKFSRRAWDGLIKNWRRRLHYWDPPSEGGGNPELLEDLNESELSEYSANDSYSLPNSVPSTPQQECKRRKEKGEESLLDYELNNDFYVNDSKYEEEEDGFKPLDE